MYSNICRKHLLERYVWCLREVVCINLLNWWYTCVAHSGVKYENELAFGGNDEFHAFLQFLDLHEKLTEKEDMSWLLLCNTNFFSLDNFSHLRWINKEASLSGALQRWLPPVIEVLRCRASWVISILIARQFGGNTEREQAKLAQKRWKVEKSVSLKHNWSRNQETRLSISVFSSCAREWPMLFCGRVMRL